MKRHTINTTLAILAIWATNGTYLALAQESAQPVFPSAAEASQSLYQAVQSNNEQAIAKILGGPTGLTSSTEPEQDKVDRELFVQKYQEMHRIGREPDGSATLYIGVENWPFPMPIVQKNGAWRFDPDAGQKEILYRRIGENELTAIITCHEFVAAERQYHANPTTAGLEGTSPESLAAKAATGSVGGDPILLHGYYYKLVAAQTKTPGAFAIIAYPAEYRSSGVMTFVVNGNDIVYEKDLGPNTTSTAGAMTAFHKDGTWRAAQD